MEGHGDIIEGGEGRGRNSAQRIVDIPVVYCATLIRKDTVVAGGYRFKGVTGYGALFRSADLSVRSGDPSTRG